jgi:glycosyltransferase involved in cell wall biosynthesis
MDMKLLLRIVIGGLEIGGAERHLVSILPKLVQSHFQVRVLTLSDKATLAPMLRDAGVEVILPKMRVLNHLPVFLRRLIHPWYALYRLVKDYRRHPKAMTHFFLPEAYILGVMAALIARPRGPLLMSRRSLNRYQQRRPVVARIERMLHRFTTFILSNSQSVLHELQYQEHIPFAKLGLIYNGINLDPFQTIQPRQQVRQCLGISDTAIVFVMVANLIPYKGYQDLITALSLIQKELPPEWYLLAIGEDRGIGATLDALATTQRIHHHIRWLGARQDIPDLLGAADIGVLSSHEEGFSNAVLECMAAGLPMVVTAVGGNPEAVVHGETGFVVPPQEPMALGKALLEMVLNPQQREEMAAKAKARIAQHFTLDACVKRYITVYHALVRHESPPRESTGEICFKEDQDRRQCSS